jgi:hypothetical protein
MSADYGENLLAQNAQQIGTATGDALMRKQNLQAFARNRRGAATK